MNARLRKPIQYSRHDNQTLALPMFEKIFFSVSSGATHGITSQTFIIIVLNSPEITNLQGLGQRCFWDDDGIGSVNSVRILDDVILSHRS